MVRVNGKIRAREVRVVTEDGRQLGIIKLPEAIRLAQSAGVDLVEVAPNAKPPVCRIVDFGRYRYEQSKRQKETRKHQHANKLKEIQLRPAIDAHDRQTKLYRAIGFLCEEMKVKILLRFRGRELAHKEIGYQVVEKFLEALVPYGQPDAPPRTAGRSLIVLVSPLPRNKRAKPPAEVAGAEPEPSAAASDAAEADSSTSPPSDGQSPNTPPASPSGFNNNPFAQLDS